MFYNIQSLVFLLIQEPALQEANSAEVDGRKGFATSKHKVYKVVTKKPYELVISTGTLGTNKKFTLLPSTVKKQQKNNFNPLNSVDAKVRNTPFFDRFVAPHNAEKRRQLHCT